MKYALILSLLVALLSGCAGQVKVDKGQEWYFEDTTASRRVKFEAQRQKTINKDQMKANSVIVPLFWATW